MRGLGPSAARAADVAKQRLLGSRDRHAHMAYQVRLQAHVLHVVRFRVRMLQHQPLEPLHLLRRNRLLAQRVQQFPKLVEAPESARHATPPYACAHVTRGVV